MQLRTAALADVVCRLNGARLIVDSSKLGLRLKYLLRNVHLNVKVVRLIRDGRGVALTYTNAGKYADAREEADRGGGSGRNEEPQRSIRIAAREWRRSNEEAEQLLKTVARDRVIEVRYERLCANPDAEMERVLAFLGLDPRIRRPNFRSNVTHVVGNGMRFDKSAEVCLDERWRTALSATDLTEFNAEAGALNRPYGYV
jgi:hypothetical protein